MSTTTCPTCGTAAPAEAATPDGVAMCRVCGHQFTQPVVPDAAAAPPAPADEPPKVYEVAPFANRRAGSPLGLGWAVALGLMGAIAVAVACAFLRMHLWLVMIFPIFQGLAVGALAGLGARLARCRYPVEVGVVGAVCGLGSAVALHYFQYAIILAANPNAPQIGFLDYMDIKAKIGVRLGKAGGAGGGANNGIGYTGSFIYWGVEALLTAAGAAGAAYACVSSPLCETCRRWKPGRPLGAYLVDSDAALAAVEAGNVAGLTAPGDGTSKAVVTLHSCPACAEHGTVDVKVVGTKKVGKNFVSKTAFVTYPGEALWAFEQFDRAMRGV